MKRASVRMAVAAMAMALAGCAGQGKLEDRRDGNVAVAQVASDVRAGAAQSFADCTWYPGAAGFSRPDAARVRPLGQLVLREDALLWGEYDMAQSVFKVGRRIPFGEIKTVWLAQKEGRKMLVLESADGGLDSFAIEHPSRDKKAASEPDAAATEEAWRYLRGLLRL
jgi:hypothetical protein